MIKENLLYIFIYFVSFGYFYSQKVTITPIVKVTYDATLNLGESYRHSEKFILIGNTVESYFAAYQNYLNDSGQYIVNEDVIDVRAISAYFQERVIKRNNNYTVFFNNEDGKIKYDDNIGLKWVLYGETKIISDVVCQMAATNKFGRRWIAYFAKDSYQIPIGPYKFGGLPGLIVELYDTKDDYHFTLTGIAKEKTAFVFNLDGYKNYTKQQYLKAKDNLEYSPSRFPDMGAEMNIKNRIMLERIKKMHNNPIELKPFE